MSVQTHIPPPKPYTPIPRFFSKQEKIAKEAKPGDYQQIDAGAVKVVYRRILAEDDTGVLYLDPKRVVYVSESILGRMELQGEVATALDIRTSLYRERARQQGKGAKVAYESHIQTQLKSLPDGSVEAPAAIGNLDKYVRRPLTLKKRLILCQQVILGMRNMQKAGYVTGDAKLENILVFNENGRIIIRLSDFGKAIRLSEGSVALMKGNGRFAASEGLLTREAEVFSTALMLIRILEEKLTPEGCEKYKVDTDSGHSRRGIEGRLLQEGRKNKKGVVGSLDFFKKYVIAKLTGGTSSSRADLEERVIHQHIDELSKAYFLEYSGEDESKDEAFLEIFSLLKDMTRANPSDRPSLETVNKLFYKAIKIISS